MNELKMAFHQMDLSQVLYELLKARGEDLTFAEGVVRRVFIDTKAREAVIETASGHKDYALDAGVPLMLKAIKAYVDAYPDEYAAFIKEYRSRPNDPFVDFTKGNIDLLFKDDKLEAN